MQISHLTAYLEQSLKLFQLLWVQVIYYFNDIYQIEM